MITIHTYKLTTLDNNEFYITKKYKENNYQKDYPMEVLKEIMKQKLFKINEDEFVPYHMISRIKFIGTKTQDK